MRSEWRVNVTSSRGWSSITVLEHLLAGGDDCFLQLRDRRYPPNPRSPQYSVRRRPPQLQIWRRRRYADKCFLVQFPRLLASATHCRHYDLESDRFQNGSWK